MWNVCLRPSGLCAAVWQAKKPQNPKNKDGLGVVKELADTRRMRQANKGVIATTTYLTKGALQRVAQEEYLLGKCDRDDLLGWLKNVAQS